MGNPMQAGSAIIQHEDWQEATRLAIAQATAGLGGAKPDLAILFASAAFAASFPEMLGEIRLWTRASLLVGCTGQGVIGRSREIEGEPALSLLLVSLPGATLRPYHFTQEEVEEANGPVFWHLTTAIEPADVHSWLVLGDPFHLDGESLVKQLNDAYPGVPIVGGMASGEQGVAETSLFLNDEVYHDGAIGVAIGGAWTLAAVVSQGCKPIGEPWTITGAERNVVRQIARKPAYQVLVETLQSLSEADQHRAQRNLLVGLAISEYQDEFKRGDFLVRNIMGVDPQSGEMAVAALPRPGQTLQFQLRDAAAATEDIEHLLAASRRDLAERPPAAGLLFSCNGRGTGLFGAPDHDAKEVAKQFGPLPLAGFFCNGEIGPVGPRAFVHGFTASLGLFVRK